MRYTEKSSWILTGEGLSQEEVNIRDKEDIQRLKEQSGLTPTTDTINVIVSQWIKVADNEYKITITHKLSSIDVTCQGFVVGIGEEFISSNPIDSSHIEIGNDRAIDLKIIVSK